MGAIPTKMIRKVFAACLTTVVLLLAGCAEMPTDFRAPTADEINAYAAQNQYPLVNTREGEHETYILFGSEESFGYAVLSVRASDGEWLANSVNAARGTQTISVISQTSGDPIVYAVWINDPNLQGRTGTIEVTLEDGFQLTGSTNGTAGAILLGPGPNSDPWQTIILYDSRGEPIYYEVGEG